VVLGLGGPELEGAGLVALGLEGGSIAEAGEVSAAGLRKRVMTQGHKNRI
jgi:hypothetical protein